MLLPIKRVAVLGESGLGASGHKTSMLQIIRVIQRQQREEASA